MKIWVDAQLPPTLASWLNITLELEASSLRDLGLRDARDIEIFEAARVANAVIMTKDSDFIDLVCRLGIPPRVIWLTCGNVTNRNLRQLLSKTLTNALDKLQQGEIIVEISNISP
jgi:predicted nuclease of predicted toxin-antitoxin system